MDNRVKDTDRGMSAMLKRLLKADGELTVGLHADDGAKAHGGAGETTLVEIAAFHEFGTVRSPRRSMIADWEDEGHEKHREQLRKMGQALIKGAVVNVPQGLERLGNLYVAEVQKRISSGIAPELNAATIKRKGSSVPLIDSGQLRSSITYGVDGKIEPAANFAAKETEKKEASAKKSVERDKKNAVKGAERAAKRERKKAFKKRVTGAKKAIKGAGKSASKATRKATQSLAKRLKKALKKKGKKKR